MIRGKKITFTCVASSDLKCTDSIACEWESVGGDPHFLLRPNTFEQFTRKGWLSLKIDMQIEDKDNDGEAVLYWDDGSGFSERTSYHLHGVGQGKAELLFAFPGRVVALRFDPMDHPGRFKLNGITILQLHPCGVILGWMSKYSWHALLHPAEYLKIGKEFLLVWHYEGLHGIKNALSKLVATTNGQGARNYLQTAVSRHKRDSADISYSTIYVRRRINAAQRKKRKRIAIGLIEHIGDIVATEPVTRYLRKHYPQAEINWIVKEEYRELIDSNPNVDRTITVDCLTDWIKIVAHKTFEIYFDLHVNGRICQQCRVPLKKIDGNPLVTGDNYFNYGSLLEAFSIGAGLPAIREAPLLYIPNDVVGAINTLALPKHFVVFHCASNNKEKDWLPELWRELALWVVDKYRLTVIEIGTDSLLVPSARVINLCHATSLLGTAEVIRRSVLFVGLDSGPAQMANAVGSKGVILLGSFGGFENYNPYTGGYGDRSKAVLIRASDLVETIPLVDVQAAVIESLKTVEEHESHELNSAFSVELTPTSTISTEDQWAGSEGLPRLIAFYLPQFHPTPENDAFWGKGFTEWINVGRARPMFDGHYQPRLPGEFGYYDLRVAEVMDRQADLARSYGIYGFCYYYYWFQGRRPLYHPLEMMLQRKSPAFPFCYCWANENWTRRWDGGNQEILIGQQHTPEDDLRFIRTLFPVFEDQRYIRVNDKPLLMVYRTELFPDIRRTVELWRSEARKSGFDGLYLVRCEGFDSETSPNDIGFDAAYEVPTFDLPKELDCLILPQNVSSSFRGRILEYEKIVRYYTERPRPKYKRYRGIMLAWDNTPRHRHRAIIFNNVSSALYAQWLRNSISFTQQAFNKTERMIFINAWNEWAEGSYLEPDGQFGRDFLEATRDTIETPCSVPANRGQF